MSTRQVIGNRFQIADLERDLLGRGGMGDVYRGRDTHTGQMVAVKALRPEVVTVDPDAVVRFLREGEALRELDHHNIVNVGEAIEEDGRHYLVMEYVPGGSLRDLLEAEGRLSIQRTVEIALEVADALTRAHHLGIIHRDLKPSNVLLAEDGTPRLTDFGHAHLAASPRLTRTGTVLGTVLYLSPEACRGETLDTRTDIWAFGAMLYEMLSGQVPFPGETFPAVFMAILSQPVPDLSQIRPEVPDALVDLVYRMLEKDRGQRIPSVRLVGAELEAILAAIRAELPPVRYWVLSTTSRFATPTPPTEGPKHNLPVQPTPFVGREAELAELDRLLSDPDVRLVTVLGAGGMGKTRLALEAAARQRDRHAHGVYFCSLAPLRSAEAVVPTVADALGFAFYAAAVSPRQQLLNYLRQKSMLLLLDNYEHLLEGVELVSEILRVAPEVRILATSRASLNVQEEHLYHISGMAFPDRETPEHALEYSAVKLFLQSARRVRPGYTLQADDLKYISRICRLVGGMPLGILLAAAWVQMLMPQEIAAEIGRSLDFLSTDLRDVPERQRSMRAVFDHTWNLLPEGERAVMGALSVFCGGFTRHAAQEVTGASLRALMALVNRSLLRRAPTGRYEVHPLLRQYAAEKLAESPDLGVGTRDRHCGHYAAALQGWDEALKGDRQVAALAEIEAEVGNVRAALDWAVERGYVERLDQGMDGLCRFYEWRGRYEEGEAACREAAELLDTPGEITEGSVAGDRLRVLAKAKDRRGLFSRALRRLELAKQLLGESLADLEASASAGRDMRQEQAFALWQMGYTLYELGAYEAARQRYEGSLASYRALGDRWGMAAVLYHLGEVVALSGASDEAEALVREGLAIQRDLGDQRGMAGSLRVLGNIAWGAGRSDEGERLIRESVAAFSATGDRAHAAEALINLGHALMYLGRLSEAHSRLEESVAIYSDLGFRGSSSSVSLMSLGMLDALLGRYDQARASAQAALDLAREERYSLGAGLSLLLFGMLAIAEGEYARGHEFLQQSCSDLEGLVWHQFAMVHLGYTARGLGQHDQARRYLCGGLRAAAGLRATLVGSLPVMALLLTDRGEAERAVELYALASHYPDVANSQWYEDVAGKEIAAIAATLPPDVAAAAEERGRARDLEATVAELLAELEGQWTTHAAGNS